MKTQLSKLVLGAILFGLAVLGNKTGMALSEADTRFGEEIEKRALLYFVENSHPKTGLIRDRARNFGPTENSGRYRMASLASTGFGIAIFAHASERGLLPTAQAQALIEKSLAYVDANLFERAGWLYHFVDWETGKRFDKSEVSSIDTALFIAGALYAAQVFPKGEIARLAQKLYERIDFSDMMTDGGRTPTKRTLSMGWIPEDGYLPWQWDTYAEQMVMVILGLGHPKKPLPKETWKAFRRQHITMPEGQKIFGAELPLFVHQYSHLFVDFRNANDGFGNYFASSVLTTRLNHQVCDQDDSRLTYREGFWGLSASGSLSGYRAYAPSFHDGTVCPSCVAGSAMFTPDLVLTDLRNWSTGKYASKIWGRYGFTDSMNIDLNWYDPDVIGITVGAAYMAVANLNAESAFWKRFQTIGSIQNGMKQAGLIP